MSSPKANFIEPSTERMTSLPAAGAGAGGPEMPSAFSSTVRASGSSLSALRSRIAFSSAFSAFETPK